MRTYLKVPGGLDILVALGFREAEGGALVLPLTANPRHLEARKVELEAGVDLLRKRVAAGGGADGAVAATNGKDVKKGSKIPVPTGTAAASAANPAATAAAAAAAKEAKEEARLQAAKRKVDALIAEEKAKRQKAETAMQQQVCTRAHPCGRPKPLVAVVTRAADVPTTTRLSRNRSSTSCKHT